jgi:hypothetical protein
LQLRVLDARTGTTTHTQSLHGGGRRALGSMVGRITGALASGVSGVLSPSGASIGAGAEASRKVRLQR